MSKEEVNKERPPLHCRVGYPCEKENLGEDMLLSHSHLYSKNKCVTSIRESR